MATAVHGSAKGRRFQRPRAFTLVELMVVVALIGLLIALLLPALRQARDAARAAICGGNMHQIGILLAAYAADCRDYIPQPLTNHALQKAVDNSGPNTDTVAGTWAIARVTAGGVGGGCPDGNQKTHPVSFGWFYRLGYLEPTSDGDLQILHCPGKPPEHDWSGPDPQASPAASHHIKALLMKALAAGGFANPSGGNWDCNADGWTSYYHRGWARRHGGSGTPMASRVVDWQPDDGVAVDYEKAHWADLYYSDAHGDGLNILFHGGHVKFGGRDIDGMKPHGYYSMLLGGYTYEYGISGGHRGNSGWAQSGGAPSNALWKYYQTRDPDQNGQPQP